MWEPVGPLPAGVYWRRRLVAIAATLGLLVVTAWTAAAWLESAGTPAITTAVLAAAQGPAPTTTRAAPADPAVVVPPVASAPVPAGPRAITALPDPAAEQLRPDDTPRRTSPLPTPVPVPATGPVPCTNAMLGVAAEIDQPAHRVGDRPVLRLVVTNVSKQPCVRDLDPIRDEIVVWALDGTRVWSSNDCSPIRGVDLRTLVPGQPVVFAVTWAGRTSAPGCTGVRGTVPAGAYNLMTRVDDDISAPVPFARVA
jgi:hypothetical protein